MPSVSNAWALDCSFFGRFKSASGKFAINTVRPSTTSKVIISLSSHWPVGSICQEQKQVMVMVTVCLLWELFIVKTAMYRQLIENSTIALEKAFFGGFLSMAWRYLSIDNHTFMGTSGKKWHYYPARLILSQRPTHGSRTVWLVHAMFLHSPVFKPNVPLTSW